MTQTAVTHTDMRYITYIEFAAAVVLVIGAGLLFRSFWNVLRVQPGFAGDHVLVAYLERPPRYQDDRPITRFYTAEILRMTIRDGLRLALPGIALGVVIALVATRLTRAVLFTVSPAHPVSYLVLTSAVIVVALAACDLPARRAARVDELQAIRT